jgi:hypothetical protein
MIVSFICYVLILRVAGTLLTDVVGKFLSEQVHGLNCSQF